MSSENAALLAIARQANTLFVIPGGIDRLLLPLTAIEPALGSVYQTIAAAFSTNVRSVVLTAGLPYMFALEASHRLRYRLFECAAELEAVLDSSDSEIAPAEVLSLAAQSDADRRMRELSGSSEGRASLNHDACTVLVRSGQSEDIRHAALQLVLQASVLTWGALEVLARDVFREYLNATPEACARLISDAEVKKRFELTKISMERVADFGFDLSSRLGELLVEQNDLADLATIK